MNSNRYIWHNGGRICIPYNNSMDWIARMMVRSDFSGFDKNLVYRASCRMFSRKWWKYCLARIFLFLFILVEAFTVDAVYASALLTQDATLNISFDALLEKTSSDASVSAPAASELYSTSCALMDGYSGRVLYGKSSTTAMANASTTKILTCILALEYGNLSDTVTVSSRAAGQPKVRLGMTEGQEYVLKDLLYCLMLESYNDCAVAIAEHISGSVEDFTALMNEKAAEIGCQDTYFITPNGLDDENEVSFHHTTAEDICLIMRYCAWESSECETFLTITRTASYTFTDSEGTSHTATNHNSLLTTMDGALTGKTGFTNDAGYCYVMAYEKDGKRFCVALLACGWPNNKTYKWKDANTLISYAASTYTTQDIYREPKLPTITVANSHPANPSLADWGQNVSFTPDLALSQTLGGAGITSDSEGQSENQSATEDSTSAIPQLLYMISSEDEITYDIHIDSVASSPIITGQAIGYYRISINDEPICEYAILATSSAYQWEYAAFFLTILQAFLM